MHFVSALCFVWQLRWPSGLGCETDTFRYLDKGVPEHVGPTGIHEQLLGIMSMHRVNAL